MLKKSKTSAFLLSAICVLSFALISALINILIPYLVTGDLQTVVSNPGQLSRVQDILILIGILLVLILGLVSIGAYWIVRFFGERYYGSTGAIRWALFGALFALFLAAPDKLLPENMYIIGYLLKFLAVFAAFFLARFLIPIKKTIKRSGKRK